MHLPSVAVVSLLAALTATGARAQERPELAERSADAEVETEVVASLSFAGLERAPDALSRVFRLPGGGWGVSSRVFRGTIQLFDAAGRPAGTLGREGEGPGEFTGEVHGALAESGLWTADFGNARVSFFSEDLSLTGDRPLPGRVFFASQSRTTPGLLLFGLLTDGQETHAAARVTLDASEDVFGGVIGDPRNLRVGLKLGAETPDGEVWTVANSGGAVDVLSGEDLSLVERWRLPGDELAVEAPRRPPRGEPPPPQLAGVMADDNGLVWVLVGVADEDWVPGMSPADEGVRAMLDTRILAISPQEDAVVAQRRLDELCLPVAENRIACVDELGEVIHVVELEVEPR